MNSVSCSNIVLKKNHVKSTPLSVLSMGIAPLGVTTSAAGRLAHFACNWETITKDRWVLNTIKGYTMEFHTTPYQAYEPHPPRFNQEQQFLVDQELQKLLDKGAVVQLKTMPQSSFLSTLFLVPKKDGV